ncbi:hypothetical protein M569_08975 [Genlisea aurea]|uniref:FLZ-type domain-containing protein n=1 Tax=Genlisea aurea TaxID=192259 RepID=S8E0E2_9LAMI|nr:hypothetical protein M569_08975 [Genlisea aurea]
MSKRGLNSSMESSSWEHFLDRCKYCKNRIDPTRDIYMYGDFGAYCSVDCRAKQMELDERAKNRKNKSTKK